ncbi:DUF6988 family protein [Burkholderia humptydooensis]|uniref:DUF6988 family protein n=2 Tax=Burkholderia humptydooensis TaxID=430531 RepID=UPI0005A425FD|nr:hypothetical protein [Burkholderia humptydooensis]KST74429.1 hypothetical protein WS76_09850 [Burkholderia humptydooensis]
MPLIVVAQQIAQQPFIRLCLGLRLVEVIQRFVRLLDVLASLVSWLWDEVDGKQTEDGVPQPIAACFYSLALDHVSAIVELIKLDMTASAFALFRAAYEAYVRGRWIQSCANMGWLRSFAEDDTHKEFPSAQKMIDQLEKNPDFETRQFSTLHRAHWPSICDYAHGARLQVTRRLTNAEISPNFSAQDKASLTHMTAAIAILIGVGFAQVLADGTSLMSVGEKAKELGFKLGKQ